MRSIITTAALSLVLSAVSADNIPAAPPTRQVDFGLAQRESTYGKVLAITKDSILISEVGKAPASYLFHDRLAAGTVHKLVVAATSYRVSDIKVGDLVTLGLVKENKQNYCIDLSVRQRPGGLVPPGQAVEPGAGFTYYRWQNAQIAFRDHGTPIPEHLKPQVPSDLPKESSLPPEEHPGDYARAYGKKLNLPWLFRCSERKLDFDVAERKVLTGMVAEVPDHGCGLTIIAPRRGKVYYPFHDRLDSKTVQEKATSAFSYLKTDIKVGDILSIGVIKQGHGVPCCADVSIRERPGGLVPAPQIVHKNCPYHEQRNAEIAFRDKGTPIPVPLRPLLPACASGPGPICAQIVRARWKLDLDPKLDFDGSELVQTAGTVLALTDAEITIRDERKTVVAYPFHDRLADGIVHKKATEANSYRRYDVRVGDRVTLGLATENSKVFCVELSLTERPGGDVPAGVVVDQKRPWYQCRNAEIAFRDKGTPIPEHLKPDGIKLIEKEAKERLKK